MASPKKRVNPLLIVLLAVLLAAAVAVGVVFAKLHSKVTALQSGASFTLRYEITPNSPQTPPLLSILNRVNASSGSVSGQYAPGRLQLSFYQLNADGSVTKIETKSDGTVIETTTWRDGSTLTAETSPNGRVETVEKRADGTTVETVESASGEITASVSVPKSVGSTRVDIPVSKPTGSMVAVIVHPDGTEEIVRGSVVTETGIALRAEGDVRLKIIDNAKRFNDMADHWAKDAVEFASSRELFNGVGNDAFGPDRSMTRGMVSTVLARLAGADGGQRHIPTRLQLARALAQTQQAAQGSLIHLRHRYPPARADRAAAPSARRAPHRTPALRTHAPADAGERPFAGNPGCGTHTRRARFCAR